MEKIQIKLMAEYRSSGLWFIDKRFTERFGELDIDQLEIKNSELIKKLENWIDIFDTFIDWDDPGTAKYIPENILEQFENTGVELWIKLRNELKENYDVAYSSDKFRKTFNTPEEYYSFIKP